MKTTKLLLLLSVTGVIAFGNLEVQADISMESQIFQWETRPQFSSEQQRLLQLYKEIGIAAAEQPRQQAEQKLSDLSAKLGKASVRPAKADEMLITHLNKDGKATIYNPTATNLAFTVSVKGDNQWVGSRMASIGRQTYLPPKATLNITNLYWTTPRMAERK